MGHGWGMMMMMICSSRILRFLHQSGDGKEPNIVPTNFVIIHSHEGLHHAATLLAGSDLASNDIQ